MKNRNRIIANILVSALTEAVAVLLGLLLPRIILLSWGSEYNGLLSSVTNILKYLTLLEAGFNTATVQALYQSIGRGDRAQTSVIIRTSQYYYRRISIAYAAIVCLISLLYPLVIVSGISYPEMVLIILLQGSAGVINFAFRASYQQLLSAEGKYYVISIVTFITALLTFTAKIIAVKVFRHVLIMQAMGLIAVVVQIVIYAAYFNKRYGWINKKAKADQALLKNRKYYFAQQIAGLVFTSTDTLILSVVCGLKAASVYAVYHLVYSGLAQVMTLFRKSTGFVLGQAYHREKTRFKRIYEAYGAMQSMLGGMMASVSILTVMGFVRLYTDGVTDINYLDFVVALIFSFNLILECARGASLAAANIAGKAPETTSHYIAEAAVNLGSSLIFVQFWGLRGVLLGTSLAGLYRTTDSILYTNGKVLHQSPASEMKSVIGSFSLFFVFAFVGYKRLSIEICNYGQLSLVVLVSGLIVCSAYGVLFYLLNKQKAALLLKALRAPKTDDQKIEGGSNDDGSSNAESYRVH